VLFKFYCQHALSDGNQCIWIREKMLEFSSTLLSTVSIPVILTNDSLFYFVILQVLSHLEVVVLCQVGRSTHSSWLTYGLGYLVVIPLVTGSSTEKCHWNQFAGYRTESANQTSYWNLAFSYQFLKTHTSQNTWRIFFNICKSSSMSKSCTRECGLKDIWFQ